MGITEFFSELIEALPWPQEVHAEAPAEEESEDKEEGGDEKEEKQDGGEGGENEDGGEEKEEEEGGDDAGDDAEDDEEEEEEEDEPEDPKPKLEEGEMPLILASVWTGFTDPVSECAKSAQCIGYKHHYEECVERVTAQHEDENYKGPKEDCVEECKFSSLFYRFFIYQTDHGIVFHLQHCATQCAAPKLFRILK